jgi:FAD synthase
MSKRFQRGLVVGKFAPLHRGHEHLIRHAFDASDEVVIISYCKPEFAGCGAERREQWLSKLFPAARILVPTDAPLASWGASRFGFLSYRTAHVSRSRSGQASTIGICVSWPIERFRSCW